MQLNLVVQTAFLGDLLLSIPLLKKTRELWPQHKLALVCRKGFGDFFLSSGLIDQVFEVEKGNSASYQNILEKLKLFEIDHLISPHESLRTVIFCAQIRAKHKVSFKKIWNFFFFSNRIHKNLNLPDSIRQLSLLSDFDVSLAQKISDYVIHEKPYQVDSQCRLPAPPSWASMSLRRQILENEKVWLELKNKYGLGGFSEGKVVLLFPGSVWATKRWTEQGFVRVGEAFQQKGYHVYIMGGPGEESLAESISESIPGAMSLAGKTQIFESAQLIARSALVIGNDSASTHLAAACETPLIAIFGPTVLEFGYRPWSAQSYVIENKSLDCRPCGKHGHHKCPRGTHECMKDVSYENVLHTAGFTLR